MEFWRLGRIIMESLELFDEFVDSIDEANREVLSSLNFDCCFLRGLRRRLLSEFPASALELLLEL